MRKISTRDFFDIFERNNIAKSQELSGFNCLKVSARQAFVISEVCGGMYLGTSQNRNCFSYRGLGKVFHTVGRNDFVVGLFDKGVPYLTPYLFSQKYEWLVDEDFYILPIAINTEEEFEVEISRLKKKLPNPERVMVFRVETSKRGHGLENLLEYVFAQSFISFGFLVESQAPLSHSLGTPDLVVLNSNILKDYLGDLGIDWRGGFLIELAMLRAFQKNSKNAIAKEERNVSEDMAMVCEAKVENVDTTNRLRKYLSSGYFNYGVQLKTDYYDIRDKGFLSFGFDNHWRIKSDGWSNIKKSLSTSQIEYFHWYKTVLRLNLFANFTHSEIDTYSMQEYSKNPKAWLLSPDSDKVLSQMLKELKNGAIQ